MIDMLRNEHNHYLGGSAPGSVACLPLAVQCLRTNTTEPRASSMIEREISGGLRY